MLFDVIGLGGKTARKKREKMKHEYKGFTIYKRTGLDRLRRAVSGYRVLQVGQFRTLKEAKAYLDQLAQEKEKGE